MSHERFQLVNVDYLAKLIGVGGDRSLRTVQFLSMAQTELRMATELIGNAIVEVVRESSIEGAT